MKRKFTWLINLATICLCVCAIAIGVYAATSATLTVSGQIGFEAHGLTYTATAKAKGYATDPDDASTYKSEYQTFDNLTDNKITLADMYFTDLVGETVPTIEIQISITNGSLFPVEAMLSLPETTVLQSNITFDVENGLAQMGDLNDADTKTQIITIKMTLNNAETTALETLQGLDFTISLNKLAKIKGDTTNGYYMTMGSNVVTTDGIQQVQPVKWIPFAESSDGTTWSAFVNTNKPDSSKQYYFIAEKVLDIGNWTLNESITYDAGVSFNPYINYAQEIDTRDNLTNFADEYLTSNIRDLLQGEDAYKNAVYSEDIETTYEPGVEKVNLFKEYGISGYLYNNIITRTAQSLYGGEILENIPTEYITDLDALWLLSGDELKYLINDKNFEWVDGYDEGVIAETFRKNVSSNWWLRSGTESPSINAFYCMYGGAVTTGWVNESYGIRPAFQFDLSK